MPNKSFVAGEKPAPVRPDPSRGSAAPLDDLAGREHGLDAEHVIGGHAVLQTMRAAGIERDISANRADRLARGVRRVVQPVGRGRAVTCVLTTPGSTTAMRCAGSRRRIRLSRFNAMTIPPATGSEPPDKLVPLPRATKGSRSHRDRPGRWQ